MKIYQEVYDAEDLADYLLHNAWSGASDNVEEYYKNDVLEDVCQLFLDVYGFEDMSRTELNDFWWFEIEDFAREFIADEEGEGL